MVWDHIAQRPRFIVITAAQFDAKGLCDSDLNVIDEVAVPDRFEDAVTKSEHQDILNRFFPQIVVDAIDLTLFQDREQIAIELLSGRQIVSERLLEYES